MHRISWFLVAFSFFVLFTGSIEAQDKFELFGGYSYVRPSIGLSEMVVCPVGSIPACPITTANTNPNTNGFELSGVANVNSWLGAAADFGATFGTTASAPAHLQTYLFGPQFRFPGRVSPFAHVLVGVARETIGTSPYVVSSGTSNSFAAAAGVGIDIKMASFISVRPIQIDYLFTRFGGGTQNQPRISVGVVLHF